MTPGLGTILVGDDPQQRVLRGPQSPQLRRAGQVASFHQALPADAGQGAVHGPAGTGRGGGQGKRGYSVVALPARRDNTWSDPS